LEVPNAFFVDWIQEHYLPTLIHACGEVLGVAPEIRFFAREPQPLPAGPPARADGMPAAKRPPAAPASRPAGRALPAAAVRDWIASQLHPRLPFDAFVVGASNRFTHAAAMAVTQQPGEVYNPLFIHGDSGLGKTHVLHAVGHEVKHRRPDARVTYVSA